MDVTIKITSEGIEINANGVLTKVDAPGNLTQTQEKKSEVDKAAMSLGYLESEKHATPATKKNKGSYICKKKKCIVCGDVFQPTSNVQRVCVDCKIEKKKN